jgi:hypothetical protein
MFLHLNNGTKLNSVASGTVDGSVDINIANNADSDSSTVMSTANGIQIR